MATEEASPSPQHHFRYCPRCGRPVVKDANFCAFCGQPFNIQVEIPVIAPPSVEPFLVTFKQIIRGIGTYVILSLIAVTILNILILIWSVNIVIPETPYYHTTLFIIVPWIINIVELSGISFAVYHILLIVAIVSSFIFLMIKSWRIFIRELSVERKIESHSAIYTVGTIFFAVLFFNIVYYLILDAFGITPTTPDTVDKELWKLLYSFANASVWEEIVSRMLLIGMPLLFVDFFRRKRQKLRRYFLGGHFSLGKAEITFLLISSAFFSVAHIFSWDAYKLLPTFIAGLALGYLFLKEGIYAAIMLHFMVDYLSIPTMVFEGIPSQIIMGLFILVWVVIGFIYFVNYASKALGAILGRKVWPDSIDVRAGRDAGKKAMYLRDNAEGSESDRVATLDMYGAGYFKIVCPYCGAAEARYRDGRFECMRCGRYFI